MRIFKSHPLLKLVNSYIIDNPQPSNISYLWNFGSLLAFCLVIQIITGVTLAMHYNASVLEAFNSVEHIMRDVNNGWLIRYLHSNTASAFFFLVYLHIGRGLYYGSYKAPRTLVWTIGTVIFILMMATAFLGYVLPYGQMSLWGATVITNLMSAIPWLGQDTVEFIWGGFSVSNATLNRFFSLHFVLPFVLAALALMHLIALHDSAGSNNPLGLSGNYDRLPFAPYFIFKDLITIFLFMLVLSVLVFYLPNLLGDSENYVMANPMQTPPAIVPEWYLLPFYAILRSIPNKLLGVIAMFSAILILLAMPFADLSRSRGIQFKPVSKIVFFIYVGNFLVLMVLGAKHVESPYIEFGQISTVLYFAHFLILVPLISLLENSLSEMISIATTGISNLTKRGKFFFDFIIEKVAPGTIPLLLTVLVSSISLVCFMISVVSVANCLDLAAEQALAGPSNGPLDANADDRNPFNNNEIDDYRLRLELHLEKDAAFGRGDQTTHDALADSISERQAALDSRALSYEMSSAGASSSSPELDSIIRTPHPVNAANAVRLANRVELFNRDAVARQTAIQNVINYHYFKVSQANLHSNNLMFTREVAQIIFRGHVQP